MTISHTDTIVLRRHGSVLPYLRPLGRGWMGRTNNYNRNWLAHVTRPDINRPRTDWTDDFTAEWKNYRPLTRRTSSNYKTRLMWQVDELSPADFSTPHSRFVANRFAGSCDKCMYRRFYRTVFLTSHSVSRRPPMFGIDIGYTSWLTTFNQMFFQVSNLWKT